MFKSNAFKYLGLFFGVLQYASASTPPCRGASYALTSLRVVKRTFGTIEASIINKPLTGKCVFYLTEWNGVAVNPAEALVSSDCSYVEFNPLTVPALAALTAGQAFTVRMDGFTAEADIAVDSPVCEVASVTVTPTQCSSTLGITDTGYGEVTVSIEDATWDSRCDVFLKTWNGNDMTQFDISRTSMDCSSITLSSKEVGESFGYSSSYEFEVIEYPVNAEDITTINPTCFKTVSGTPTAVCTGVPTHLRPDESSLGIQLTNIKPYGACRVTLLASDGTTELAVKIGRCDRPFFFASNGGTIDLSDGATAKYKFDFFADGDITSATTCTSTVQTHTVGTYACDRDILVSSDVGTSLVSIGNPKPRVGTCQVIIKECGSTTLTDVAVDLPSCSGSTPLDYTTLVALHPTLIPGEECTVGYEHTYASATCVSTLDATVNTFVKVTPVLPPTTSGSVSIGLAGLPASLSGQADVACRAHLHSCNGDDSMSTDSAIADCNANVVFDNDVEPGDSCVLSVEVFSSSTGDVYGKSERVSVVAAGVPVWGQDQKPTVMMYGDECVEVRWTAPSSNGGAPLLCYEVQRKDASGSFYVIQECEIGIETTFIRSCGFTDGLAYRFQVIAINRVGRSVDNGSVTDAFDPEWLRSAPDSDYITPGFDRTLFVAGAFPAVRVQEDHPMDADAVDSDTNYRLYVATLVSRCKLDSQTGLIKEPLTESDVNYTAVPLPIPKNSPPAFTELLYPVIGSLGVYEVVVPSQPPAGPYSLVTYSLEAGGLYGQYWSNPFLSGTPAFSRKDPLMSFNWEMGPLINSTSYRFYDLVSVRWSGFIEAPFTETFTIMVEATDAVRVWIDDVIIINKWKYGDQCVSVCSGKADLQQSSSEGRKFHHIRVDFFHSKGPAQAKPAKFTLKWVSFSQPLEIIPVDRLFKALPIQYTVKTVDIVPDVLAPGETSFSLPSTIFSTDEWYKITITARDSYGNILDTSDSQFIATFSNQAGDTVIDTFSSVPTSKSGVYEISFKLADDRIYHVSITDAVSGDPIKDMPFFITVVTGEPHAVPFGAEMGSGFTADAPVVFEFNVTDVAGNLVLSSAKASHLYLSAQWTGDSISQSRLDVDDVAWRSEKFGTLFNDATITFDAASEKFRASILLPRSGDYSVEIGVIDGAAPFVLAASISVGSSEIASAIYSIITSEVFPPTDMAAGVVSNFTVQLRDQWMNALTVDPLYTTNVSLRLQGHPSPVACTAGFNDGSYDCVVIPEKAGTNLALSILVNGTFSSRIYDDDGVIKYTRGPWYVNVSAGTVNATMSVLTGVKTTYTAGVAANAILLLRDSYGNNLGPVSAWPLIAAFFDDGDLTPITMDPLTFVYDAQDGTVTIPVIATVEDTGLNLNVTIDGNPVSLPYDIEPFSIEVVEGVVNSDKSLCTLADLTGIAGYNFTSTCQTKDKETNAVNWVDLNAFLTFKHTSDQSIAPVVIYGQQDETNLANYDFWTTSLTKVGSYYFFTTISQPGGLIAQYYALDSFSSVIGIGGSPLVNLRSGDEAPIFYTRIDPYIDFDLSGPIVIDGLIARSVSWIGRIQAPISGDVNFNVTATGGIRIVIGATEIDLLTATSVDEDFTLALNENEYYDIQIDYIPSTTAALSFKWVYDGSMPVTSHVVPPSALHALLNNNDAYETLSVTVAPVSIQSTATFSSGIVAGKKDFLIVRAIDQYGNSYGADPDACVAGLEAFPVCLFRARIPADDGSVFEEIESLTDGTFKINVTFATDGPKSVVVELQTEEGMWSQIQGSPYAIDVGPSLSTNSPITTTTTTTTTTP